MNCVKYTEQLQYPNDPFFNCLRMMAKIDLKAATAKADIAVVEDMTKQDARFTAKGFAG